MQKGSAILHGEMDCLENAGRQPAEVYARSAIYTTLSPCSMCSGAILLYNLPRVIAGQNKTLPGAEETLRANGVRVDVLQDEACIRLMREFIEEDEIVDRLAGRGMAGFHEPGVLHPRALSTDG